MGGGLRSCSNLVYKNISMEIVCRELSQNTIEERCETKMLIRKTKTKTIWTVKRVYQSNFDLLRIIWF